MPWPAEAAQSQHMAELADMQNAADFADVHPVAEIEQLHPLAETAQPQSALAPGYVTRQITPRQVDLAWRKFPELPITTITVPGYLEPTVTYDMRACKAHTGFPGPYFWDDFDQQMLCKVYEAEYATYLQQPDVGAQPADSTAVTPQPETDLPEMYTTDEDECHDAALDEALDEPEWPEPLDQVGRDRLDSYDSSCPTLAPATRAHEAQLPNAEPHTLLALT